MNTCKIFLLIFLLIFACGGKKFEEPGKVDTKEWRTEVGFKASFIQVWKACFAVMKKYPMNSSNSKKGEIESDWVYDTSDTLYSGYGDARIPYKIRYKINLFINQSEKILTTVRVKIQEQYYSDVITKGDDFEGSLYKWYDTESSTIKENYLLREIEAELKKQF